MKQYQHIFFDLDRTLWDLERNSTETLTELYYSFGLGRLGMPEPSIFLADYNKYNDILWERYRNGLIDKQTLRALRFKQTFAKYGVRNDKLAEKFADAYVMESPKKNFLLPHAKELLDYLAGKKYLLHIITNGFEEVQHVKMLNSGITSYFTHVITSEKAGYTKPDKKVFEFSLNLAGSRAEESLMVGDHLEADIVGARNAGIDQVYLNPGNVKHDEAVTYEISALDEMYKIL